MRKVVREIASRGGAQLLLIRRSRATGARGVSGLFSMLDTAAYAESVTANCAVVTYGAFNSKEKCP
jgi:hypothetical protein